MMPALDLWSTLGQHGLYMFRKANPGILVSQRLNPLKALSECQQALPELVVTIL
jgi:hypothetical protein